MSAPPIPTKSAMSIAGFDPGSGAGVTADLLTFAAHGLFATSAITALTVQSTRGVRRVAPVDALLLRDTLAELESDLPADGIKLGMLGGVAQVRVVIDFLQAVRATRPIQVVLDPVLVSTSGAELLQPEALDMMREELLPLVDASTPNAREAALLAQVPCESPDEAEACARRLRALYPQLVPVITGGHWDRPRDLLLQGDTPTWIDGHRITTNATHGTGCAFSSALLAARLQGHDSGQQESPDWLTAVRGAKAFVRRAMISAEPRGSGPGPMNLRGS